MPTWKKMFARLLQSPLVAWLKKRVTLRMAKWTGLVATLLMLLVWGAAILWSFGYFGLTASIAFEKGGVTVVYGGVEPYIWQRWWGRFRFGGSSDGYFYSLAGYRLGFWRYTPDFIMEGKKPFAIDQNQSVIAHHLLFRFPLWLPLGLFGVCTGFMWLRDRRKMPHGCCSQCGYDLTANTSGVCPECGGAASVNRGTA